MPTLTVRGLSEKAHRALRVRAAGRGLGKEAEARQILESFASDQPRLKLGSLLAGIGREVQLSEEEFAVFAQARDQLA